MNLKVLTTLLLFFLVLLPSTLAGLTGGLNINENTVYYNLDTTAPVVVNQAPPNSSNSTTGSINFIYNTGELATCNLYINGGDNASQSAVVGNNTLSSTLQPQEVAWYVSCVDVAGNVGNSTGWNLTVQAADTTLSKYTFGFQECDVTSTPKAIVYAILILIIVGVWIFAWLQDIPILNIFIGVIIAYFSWYVVACFMFAGILFILLGVLSIGKGIASALSGKSF